MLRDIRRVVKIQRSGFYAKNAAHRGFKKQLKNYFNMVSIFNTRGRFLYIPLFFLLAFSIIAFFYIARANIADRNHFKTHAAIIADDIWALNQDGAKPYLQLAIKAHHYKSLSVSIPGDKNSLQVFSPPLTGFSHLLYKLKLIGTKKLSEDISHEGISIGTLHGEQYVRVIFPLLNILISLLLVLLTSIFILYLFHNRRILEQQILERTQNLKESEGRFHDLVNSLPEIVLETDMMGNITYANREAILRFNISSDQPHSSNIFNLILEEEREKGRKDFPFALQSGSSILEEFTSLNSDGSPFPVLVRAASIVKDGQVIGARVIAIDMTERRHLEEQLRRDQKMKAIGLMAGGVAHDLNNILSGIISYPELLLLDLTEDDHLRRPLEAIRKAGLDASEVVSDLLTVARGVTAATEIIGPHSLVQDYLDSPDFHQLRSRYPLINFAVSHTPSVHNISCSPIHVRKCLMNLITNGVEAIQGKGTVTISTENHQTTDRQLDDKNILPAGSYSKIVVRDSGTGIDPHEIDHIFEPFYTKKVMGRSGTGLGLAVVWNTMRDHGGTVNVISNPHGTTFELYFPSIEEAIASTKEKEDWRTFKGHGETVLVVDDEPRQREIAAELLTSLDYSVETAASGKEAVEYLKHHSVDIVILDMLMAPGQNGRKTFEQILQLHPQQKAVIASGYAEDDDVRATLKMGAGAFVAKPYTLTQIGSALYKALFP
jgi:two-component system cell cycle sensor histidine kinase/response regulator CckA